jgi:hypothetical protein
MLVKLTTELLAKQKLAGARRLVKNLQFNFTNTVVWLKLGQNSSKYLRHSPKKGVEFFAQKIYMQMLMKLTLENPRCIEFGTLKNITNKEDF